MDVRVFFRVKKYISFIGTLYMSLYIFENIIIQYSNYSFPTATPIKPS